MHVWAAARSGLARQWLRDNGIISTGEGCAPDVKAGDLALLLAKARILGDEVGGLMHKALLCPRCVAVSVALV